MYQYNIVTNIICQNHFAVPILPKSILCEHASHKCKHANALWQNHYKEVIFPVKTNFLVKCRGCSWLSGETGEDTVKHVLCFQGAPQDLLLIHILYRNLLQIFHLECGKHFKSLQIRLKKAIQMSWQKILIQIT